MDSEKVEENIIKDVKFKTFGLPPSKLHSSNLGADALHKAIEDYLAKTTAPK
jgi:NifU-like protein involved in Fe-S cluster formation